MSADPEEIKTLATLMREEHDEEVIEIAAMAYLSNRLLTRFASASGFDATRLVNWQRRGLDALIDRQGISRSQVHAAVNALKQSGMTAHYLESLPD